MRLGKGNIPVGGVVGACLKEPVGVTESFRKSPHLPPNTGFVRLSAKTAGGDVFWVRAHFCF